MYIKHVDRFMCVDIFKNMFWPGVCSTFCQHGKILKIKNKHFSDRFGPTLEQADAGFYALAHASLVIKIAIILPSL